MTVLALRAVDCTGSFSSIAKRKTQWHPLLAGLLRHEVERYYELLTNLPVGDLPRQADIVLLRRLAAVEPPFRGLWRYLTPWNVLEYKGPTVAARREHLPLLIEVGLGIARRLNEQSIQQGERPTPEGDISFWYLANLGIEAMEQQIAVGQFLIETAQRADKYGGHFAAFHGTAWEEVLKMARHKRGGLEFDLRPIVETMGMGKVIEKLGEDEVLEELLARLSPAKRRKLQRRLNAESDEKGSKD